MAPVRSTRLPDGGFALPLVIMITTIIMFLSTAFLTLADTEQTIAQNQVAETQALYIADAGVEKALHVLNKNANLLDTVTGNVYTLDVDVGEGTANVTVQEQGGLIEITSTGQKGNAKKTVIAKVAPPAWEYGLLGGGEREGEGSKLTLEGNSYVNADIAYRGDIEIKGSRTVTAHKVVVTGNLTVNGTLEAEHESADPPVDILHVGGNVSAGKDNDIQGNWQYDVEGSISPEGAIEGVAADFGEQPYVPPPPQIDWAWYQENADWSAADPNDDDVVAKLETEPSEREILYFSGNLTMRSQQGQQGQDGQQGQHGQDPIEFKGVRVLVVDGYVEVKDKIVPFDDNGNGEDDDGNALLILATGNVVLTPAGGADENGADENGADKKRNLIVISEGTITMSGKVELEGSFWSSTITTNGTVDISYDEDMVELIRATGLVKEYSYRLVSWQEQYPVF